MITKNSFFGAYLIKAASEGCTQDPIESLISEATRAWSVIEALQEKPVYIDGALLDASNDVEALLQSFLKKPINKMTLDEYLERSRANHEAWFGKD